MAAGVSYSAENPIDEGHLYGSTMVYFDLETTGLGYKAEICQIGAYFAERHFSKYVCPEGEFESGAAEATNFSKMNGALCLHGQPVETVSLLDAWRSFLQFLESANKSVVLVIHNRPFDSRFLLRDLYALQLIGFFRKMCVGMIDTLPLCREIFPARKQLGKNYKLEDLVRDMIGDEHAVGCHNALVDVRNMEKLLKHANVTKETLKKHYLSLPELEYSRNLTRKANFLKYKIPNLSLDMAKKITEAAITYEDLLKIYSAGGEAAIASLLCEKKADGKPRVTSREAVVKDIAESLSKLQISS